MNEQNDKALVLDLLKQAAERTSMQEALFLMMSTTPRGDAINWVSVRTTLQDFIADLTLPPNSKFAIAAAGDCNNDQPDPSR